MVRSISRLVRERLEQPAQLTVHERDLSVVGRRAEALREIAAGGS